MANSQQQNTDLEPSKAPAAALEKHGEEEIPITHRLRNREMLRKRKEEAQEKDSACWIYRMVRTKKPKKSGGAKQGGGKQPVLAPKPASELKAEMEAKPAEELVEELEDVPPKPKPQEKAEPVAPESVVPEPVAPESVVPEPVAPESVVPEPVAPEPVAPEPAPPEPVQQEQLPVLTTQGLGSGMPMVAVDGDLATRSQDAVGDEGLLNLAEAEIPDDLDTPLDNLCQDNEYMPFLV